MAIAVMRKLRVAAISYEENRILDALSKTGAVEIKFLNEEGARRPSSDVAAISSRLEEAKSALEELSSFCDRYSKEHKVEFKPVKDGFFITYEEFMNSLNQKGKAEDLIKKINERAKARADLNASVAAMQKNVAAAEPYRGLEIPFSSFANTARTRVFLGTAADKSRESYALLPQTAVLKTEGDALLFVALKRDEKEAEEFLRGIEFTICPFLKEESTGKELYARFLSEKERLLLKIKANDDEEFALKEGLKLLKTYCDRLAYEEEKATETSEKMLATERTILLEAYTPKGSEEEISNALNKATDSAYFDFSNVEEGETPPTLMKNNELFKNFEAVTNLYSPPNAKELDPTTIMGLFYSVFLGFIMGDVGYGLFMLLGGGILWWKNRVKDNGLKRLSAVFAVGGFFAVLWGILFNSFFGVGILLPVRVLPPLLSKDGNINWTLMGIKIPSLLVIALEIGIVQLFAGYVCRAIQAWRRGKAWDGVFDGVVWAIFSVGAGLAIAGLIKELNRSILALIGGGMAGGALAIAIFTAGRHEKFLGKFTKGFGTAYGIINYASDILSYARLYGLMLSGAVIAEIITGYAVTGYNGGAGMMQSGSVPLAILGAVLMLAGHSLNLALGLLGAYIHDARLQYVEFYGRFYEGEGTLFSPLGAKHSHVFIVAKAFQKPKARK